MNPRPSNQSRNISAWSLTTLAQTLGCRIPLVRTVIVEAYRDRQPRSHARWETALQQFSGWTAFGCGRVADLLSEIADDPICVFRG